VRRGRAATRRAYEHLGLEPPREAALFIIGVAGVIIGLAALTIAMRGRRPAA